MRFVIWAPIVAAFLVWSLFSWLLYKLVDWVVGLIASGFGAVLGNWAAWLINACGDLGQFVVVLLWAVVSWMILRPARLLTGR